MRRSLATTMLLVLLAGACADFGGDAPEPTTTAPAGDESTTTGPATSTGGATTTAPTTSSTAPPKASTTTSTTGVPDTTAGPDSSTEFSCPDLLRANDAGEVEDVMLASWRAGGESLWEIPLGTVQPVWAVAGDEVILGFSDGTLVGVEIATCAGWEISLPGGGIDQLAITESGMIIAVHGGSISAFTGPGVAAWRHAGADGGYRFAGENNGIAVFVDQFGDIVGIDAAGGIVFEWGGASGLATVAVSETFVYRGTGAEVAARPVAGGDVVWAGRVSGIEALFTAPGLLLAQDDGNLHALAAGSGELLWSIPFDGEIASPVVVEHGELHLAARHTNFWYDTLWHLDPADGATIMRGTAPPNTEWFPEMDDALLLQVGEDGRVTAIDMQQRVAWVVETGANRVGRFTQAETAPGGVVITLSFSGERF